MLTQKTGRERASACVRERERERKSVFRPFGSSFYMLFPPPGPALCNLGQPGVLFVLPEVLTRVLGPSFVLFLGAFPFFVFQLPPFWTPFSYYDYVTVPNASADVEQWIPHSLLVGLQNSAVILKDSWEVSYKTKYSIHFLYNPGILAGIHQKGVEN